MLIATGSTFSAEFLRQLQQMFVATQWLLVLTVSVAALALSVYQQHRSLAPLADL